ncbi:hypothetical protein C1645_828540 [Glomus cerebriforme]|uniref:Uncharacterized protein n=1 Tax=Glomus cerebriforme TaxID=658196 RepID=A0A397SW26_9GLOM|nr:hypothetical protein C1645_828540 [Glomus cerebriforme]
METSLILRVHVLDVTNRFTRRPCVSTSVSTEDIDIGEVTQSLALRKIQGILQELLIVPVPTEDESEDIELEQSSKLKKFENRVQEILNNDSITEKKARSKVFMEIGYISIGPDIDRSILNVLDGLKPGQRNFVLRKVSRMKGTVKGTVLEQTPYYHANIFHLQDDELLTYCNDDGQFTVDRTRMVFVNYTYDPCQWYIISLQLFQITTLAVARQRERMRRKNFYSLSNLEMKFQNEDRLGNLDDKYDVAISTARSALNDLVVDSANVMAMIIEKLGTMNGGDFHDLKANKPNVDDAIRMGRLRTQIDVLTRDTDTQLAEEIQRKAGTICSIRARSSETTSILNDKKDKLNEIKRKFDVITEGDEEEQDGFQIFTDDELNLMKQ